MCHFFTSFDARVMRNSFFNKLIFLLRHWAINYSLKWNIVPLATSTAFRLKNNISTATENYTVISQCFCVFSKRQCKYVACTSLVFLVHFISYIQIGNNKRSWRQSPTVLTHKKSVHNYSRFAFSACCGVRFLLFVVFVFSMFLLVSLVLKPVSDLKFSHFQAPRQ